MVINDKNSFDIIVIGAGPAGIRAAIVASVKGLKTALFDAGELGGVCVNSGCIPIKSMLHVSSIYYDTKHELEKFGIEIKNSKINFKKLMSRIYEIIESEHSEIKKALNNKNLTIIKEKVSFLNNNTIHAGKEQYTAKKFLIATGSKPHVPPIKGLEKIEYKLSDDFLSLDKLPDSVIIIGGGYIAMELSTFFNDLGTKVTILEASPAILSNFDSEVCKTLEKQYSDNNVSILTNVHITNVTQKNGKKFVEYESDKKNKSLSASELFVIAGRMPNTKGLNLEIAGINKGEKGNILVNERLQTSNPDVFAIGDVNGRSYFANIAQREGSLVIDNIFNNQSKNINPLHVPWSTGTRPRLAHVGITEKEAKEKNLSFGILKADINKAAGSIVHGHTTGFAKVIYDKESRKVLGCTLLTHSAEEIIHEITSLMQMNGTIDDLKSTLHVHPTLGEVFEYLREVRE